MERNTKSKRVRVGVRLPESLVKRVRAVALKQRRTFTSLTEEAIEASLKLTR